MRLNKHLYGFVVFVTILTAIASVYEYFRWTPTSNVVARTESVTYEAQPVDYDVRLVSLDFIGGKTYTTLSVKLPPGQPAPEKLMVSTRFYLPYADNAAWTSTVGVRLDRPRAAGEPFEVTVESDCDWCDRPGTPKAGYFADVYVLPRYQGKIYLPTPPLGPLVEAAVPVVVQAGHGVNR